MESLTGIVAFVQTAESSSFVAAGRALGISSSAVGKSVSKLEKSLGVRLFHRTTRRVALTQEGVLFLERCRQVLEDLRDAKAALSHAAQGRRGRLRVSVPTIGYRFLVPLIPEFQRLYPEIELELDCSDRLVELVEEGFDAVIRSGALADSSFAARRLGPFFFRLCASPEYLERKGVPRTPGDLSSHHGLYFRVPMTGKLQEWSFKAAARVNFPCASPALTCNNMEAIRAATVQGLGIGYMPDFLVRTAIERGQLRTVLDTYLQNPGHFSILWPSNRQLAPKLRAFVDFLAHRLFKPA